MKKVFLRLAKYTAFFFLLLLVGGFIWANWNPPSPGERAAVVDFVPYDMHAVSDPTQAAAIAARVEQIGGVRGATYNPESQLMSVAYGIDDTDRETIEATVQQHFHIQLHEKVFKKAGPRCPVGGSMTLIARIKGFLCVRD